MCGIIGYTGSENVKDVLLDALELLEYRGYGSERRNFPCDKCL